MENCDTEHSAVGGRVGLLVFSSGSKKASTRDPKTLKVNSLLCELFLRVGR